MKKVLIVALIPLALWGCGRGATTSGTSSQINVTASDFKFEPATVEVSVDVPVQLNLRNTGAIEHDWAIIAIPVKNVDEKSTSHGAHAASPVPQLHVSALNATTARLTFTATQKGTFEVVCTVPGHKELGMVGKLIVK